MKTALSRDMITFLEKQSFLMVSTLDSRGKINCSAKGIVGIEDIKIFIIDLYRGRTYRNLKKNPNVTLTSIDEHSFAGITIQGKAKVVLREEIENHIIKKWEDSIIRRISNRIIKSVQSSLKSRKHFEMGLPRYPKYLIEVEIDNVIDLSPIREK